MAPTPLPTIQTQPNIVAPAPVIAAPTPAKTGLEGMNKQEMIKLLLAELAKPETQVWMSKFKLIDSLKEAVCIKPLIS